MIKICHISDIHIRNNTRHEEYELVFDKFYNFLQEEKCDYLIITGDVAHSKSTISPEYVKMCYTFIHTCSLHVNKTIIIPGNHDINEKNRNRLDTLTPIVDALKSPDNILLFTESCIYNIPDTNINIVNFSILDDNRNLVTQTDKFNIGLFHGIIKGAKTHLGFDLKARDEAFVPCDLFMLGDVHERQKLAISGKPAWYAGSMIQQDHGETSEKGGIIYKIDDVNKTYSVEYFNLKNEYGFKDVTSEEITNGNLDPRLKIRVVDSIEKISQIRNLVKNENISFKILKTEADQPDKQKNNNIVTLSVENINNIIKENFQEYIDLYGDELLQINSKYLSGLTNSTNNKFWKIKNVKWSNLFSYGDNVELNLEKDAGKIVGIFGKNKTGKSSVIDAICFSIYGQWTKRNVTNDVYINNLKDFAETFIEIQSDCLYSIKRTIKRTAKGSTSTVMLLKDGVNICGDDKKATEAEINSIFGKMENFLLTTIIKQYDDISLLKKKTTQRKEILNTFLGLNELLPITEKISQDLSTSSNKVEAAKAKVATYKNVLESYGDDFIAKTSDKISELTSEIDKTRLEYKVNNSKLETIKKFEQNTKNLAVLEQSETELNSLNVNIENSKQLLKDAVERINDPNGIFFRRKELKKHLQNLKNLENSITSCKRDTVLLDTVPCKNQFPQCKFLQNANTSLENLKNFENQINEVNNIINEKFSDILPSINSPLKEEESSYIYGIEKEISLLEKSKNSLLNTSNSLKDKILDFTDEDLNLIKNKDEFFKMSNILTEKGTSLSKDKTHLESKLNEYNNYITLLKDCETSLDKFAKEHNILSAYSKIMGKNGVIVHILNQHLDDIKNNINILLSQTSTLEIDIQIDDNQFDIYFKDVTSNKFKTIECASGMEEFIIGLAFRLVLNKVSVIAKNNFIILDEPGTSLDLDNQRVFGDTLVNLLSDFDNIIIVTHLEILKDYVNSVINIKKNGDYSYLE
jgi:DNA repair exonuclease SbcCD ATPase subunit/DNA repair exonuclease SbcCD nuclease subunit